MTNDLPVRSRNTYPGPVVWTTPTTYRTIDGVTYRDPILVDVGPTPDEAAQEARDYYPHPPTDTTPPAAWERTAFLVGILVLYAGTIALIAVESDGVLAPLWAAVTTPTLSLALVLWHLTGERSDGRHR